MIVPRRGVDMVGTVFQQHLQGGVGLRLRGTIHKGSTAEHGDGALMAGPAERAFFDHVTLPHMLNNRKIG